MATAKYPPWAKVMPFKMKTRGKYKAGWPSGAVVHYTAGRRPASLKYGADQGHCYWLIQADGTLEVAHPADEWGSHAGVSSYPGIGSGVSQYLIGFEIAAAGRVTKNKDGSYQTWFKTSIPASSVRTVAKQANVKAGSYEMYTPAQEATLIKTLLWLEAMNPAVFYLSKVVGHDEVAPARKEDPGGALSCTMPEFRAKLYAELAKGRMKV